MTDQRDLAKERISDERLAELIDIFSDHQQGALRLDSDTSTALRELEELRRPAQSEAADAARKHLADYRETFAPYPHLLKPAAQAHLNHIEALLSALDQAQQDNIRYSNAHKILLAERDEARGKCERLQVDLLQAIEAYEACSARFECAGDPPDPLSAKLRQTLAAADGQQEETCRCAVTCLVAKGGKTLKLDGTPYKCKGLPATREHRSATGDGVEGE